MGTLIEKAWTEVLKPLLRRPPRLQVAALCHRLKDGRREVLVITSRGTGRWIIPKGWPIPGQDGPGTALQEAWEEAGVRKGRVSPAPLGGYGYVKLGETGLEEPCRADVYAIAVREMARDYPERAERRRKWVTPARAAEMVDEPELREILRNF